jgi:O-antigen/teichoic acid export membrane protein
VIGGKIRGNFERPEAMSTILRSIALALLLLLESPAAFAYLDPSTGSMVVSAIVGIFASIALALKTYWYKIKGLFRRNPRQDSAPGDSRE